MEEEKGQGLLNRLHLRLHRDLRRCGEAIKRKASTGVDQLGEERASFEDDGEDDKDNERTTEQRFEVAESYEIRTAAESYEIRTAASKQYGVEVSKKEKWTMIRYLYLLFLFLSPCSFVVSISGMCETRFFRLRLRLRLNELSLKS